MKNNKKGQTGGMVTSLVMGIASLIIAIIIAFVIVTTIGGSNLLSKETITTTNESELSGNLAFINQTTYTIAEAVAAYSGAEGYTVVVIWADWNQSNGSAVSIAGTPTGYNVSLDATNYTLDSTTGILINATNYVFPNVSVSYTYDRDTTEIKSADGLSGNFSSGINNVSGKIPTILLIAAIVLILSILAILIGIWNRMRSTTII